MDHIIAAIIPPKIKKSRNGPIAPSKGSFFSDLYLMVKSRIAVLDSNPLTVKTPDVV
jgi:hypothetical protein